jgi:acetylornithine/succinyldiaminopimelate/putrescine aminotransferase
MIKVSELSSALSQLDQDANIEIKNFKLGKVMQKLIDELEKLQKDTPIVLSNVTEAQRMKNILNWAFKCPLCNIVYYNSGTCNNELAEKWSRKNEDGFHEMTCFEAGGACDKSIRIK